MSYCIIPPCQSLKDFISHYWVGNWEDSNASSSYFMTANSLTEIAFIFRGSSHGIDSVYASVQGQTNQYAQYSTGGVSEMLGISIFSHTIPYLFDLPAYELNNRFIRLDKLIGNPSHELIEKIALAASTNERIQILNSFFRQQLLHKRAKEDNIIKAIQRVRQQKGNVNIVALADDFCLSQKQFERRFKHYAGFMPKLYARIVCFETILNSREKFQSLTESSYALGYYDQAHLIHDFKAFSGYSPKQFFALSPY